MKKHKFFGVYSAVLTPMDKSNEPDEAAFIDHCLWLLDNGCDGIAPLGTTGEANSLSVSQRLDLIDALSRSSVPLDKCIIGTGSCAVSDAKLLTREAVSAGCGAVLLLPPFYYKKPSEDGLFEFFSSVISSVDNSDLRVFLYHYPQLSTVPITAVLLRRLLGEYGEILSGVKDSEGDFERTKVLISEFPELSIFSGSEEFLLPNLQAGGPGCISASTNVTSSLAQLVCQRWQHDDAASLQETLVTIRKALQSVPMQAGLKYLVGKRTGLPTWESLLPPNQPLTKEQICDLEDAIGAIPGAKHLLQDVQLEAVS